MKINRSYQKCIADNQTRLSKQKIFAHIHFEFRLQIIVFNQAVFFMS
jgi:hypothetical protein